jgi:hydroxysqualene synthase
MTGQGAGSSKTEHDENFPVASRLVAPQHRPVILAFYRFVRKADDFADHPKLAPQEKLDALDAMGATLDGADDRDPEGVLLRKTLEAHALSPVHARDLLSAFRLDATKRRYRDRQDLIDYCALSAMPVGRFVLDVHGESPALWPASDAICASLQVINHLQDCAEDYANLDRVYLPEDALQRAGAQVADLAAPSASPALRAVIVELAKKCGALLDEGAGLAAGVADWRLACEIGAIVHLARANVDRLTKRDPLSERVHPSKPVFVLSGLVGAAEGAIARAFRGGGPAPAEARGK